LVKYGNDFIEAISKYVSENNISVSHTEKKSEKPKKLANKSQ
jgi:hypothetical protein